MGVVFQPLAEPPQGIEQIQVVQPVTAGGQADNRQTGVVSGAIIRCKKCRTYINPYVTWEYNGRRWKCNICGFTNETAHMYYAPIGEDGKREDIYERPELCNGAVEYIAT